MKSQSTIKRSKQGITLIDHSAKRSLSLHVCCIYTKNTLAKWIVLIAGHLFSYFKVLCVVFFWFGLFYFHFHSPLCLFTLPFCAEQAARLLLFCGPWALQKIYKVCQKSGRRGGGRRERGGGSVQNYWAVAIAAPVNETVNGIVFACFQRYSPSCTTKIEKDTETQIPVQRCGCICICVSGQRHQKVFWINSRFMHSTFARCHISHSHRHKTFTQLHVAVSDGKGIGFTWEENKYFSEIIWRDKNHKTNL